MIAKLSSLSSFGDPARYNQKKVDAGVANILYKQKLTGTKAETIEQNFKDYNYTDYEKPSLHIAISFTGDDASKLSDANILKLSREYLDKMGYGQQPYIVYRHHDSEYPHVHVLTTRVNPETQTRINNAFEHRRSRAIINEMERRYGLSESNLKTIKKDTLQIDLTTAFTKSNPKNLKELNQVLSQNGTSTRIKDSPKGLVYYRVGEDEQPIKKNTYKATYFKEIGFDKEGLQNRFQENQLQTRINSQRHIERSIEKIQPLDQTGSTRIGYFLEALKEQDIVVDYTVHPDNTVVLNYQHKDQQFTDQELNTSLTNQIHFPAHSDYRLQQELKASIQNGQPIELQMQGNRLTVQTANPELKELLEQQPTQQLITLTRTHNQVQDALKNNADGGSILATALKSIEDTLSQQTTLVQDQRQLRVGRD